jgi:hypothetical protein
MLVIRRDLVIETSVIVIKILDYKVKYRNI